jgi:hypothetical protein
MMMTPIEINRIGYKALTDALGFDGTIRFLRQFEPGFGDYTKERHQWLEQFQLEDIFTEIERKREAK